MSETAHAYSVEQALQTVVVGVDLSPESLYALDLAATIAQPQSAALRIVHVHHRPATLVLIAASWTAISSVRWLIRRAIERIALRSHRSATGRCGA